MPNGSKGLLVVKQSTSKKMSEQEQSDAQKDRCRGLKRPKHKIPKKAREEEKEEEVEDKQGEGRSTHPLTDSSWCSEVASSLPVSEGISSTCATSTASEEISSTTSATSTDINGSRYREDAESDIDGSRHREDAESELNLRREAPPIKKESSFEAKRRALLTKHAYCIGEEIMKDEDFHDDDDDDNQGETSDFRNFRSYIDKYRALR